MLKELQSLFRGRGFEQLADVLPGLQEGSGVVADPLDGCLTPGDVGQVLFDLPLLLFEPFEFRLDAGQSPRTEAFQHIDQPADVGMDLGQTAAGQVFSFTQPVALTAEARKRFLYDAVPRLDHPANRSDPPDDRVLQRFRRDAGRIAGVFAALVLLPRADVVVVLVRATVGRCPDHVCPALAPQQPGQQVNAPFRLLQVHAAGDGLADLELHPVELLLRDDRFVAIVLHRVAPANLPDVDGVAKDADDLLLGEAIAAPLLVRASAVDGIADAEVVEPPRHRPGGAEFLEQVEDAADDSRSFLVDFQLAWIVLPRAVAEDMPAVPQAPVGPVPHDRKRPLGGHLPLKLGEHHDELHHRLAGRHRGVELLPQGDDIHVMLGEERPQVHEILEAAGNPVQLEADHQVDLAGGDVALEPLKLGPLLVLRAFAGIDVELQQFDIPVLTPLAELDLLLDLVLLGRQAVALGCLALRGDADVSGDPEWLGIFLVGFSHIVHLLSGKRPLEMSLLNSPSILPGQSSGPTKACAMRARIPAIRRTRLAARMSGEDWASG